MRKEKFTKGPWRVGPVNDTLVMDANREVVAQALGDLDGEDWESVYANAALISASPNLYEALSDLVASVKSREFYEMLDAVEKADAALAKARGES